MPTKPAGTLAEGAPASSQGDSCEERALPWGDPGPPTMAEEGWEGLRTEPSGDSLKNVLLLDYPPRPTE